MDGRSILRADVAARQVRAPLPPVPAPYRSRIFRPEPPRGWEIAQVGQDGAAYRNKSLGLIVISSATKELDGKWWHHVSVSRRTRTPTWQDMTLAKRLFIGEAHKAVQIMPPATEHVNIHPFCLHMWSCLEGDLLPDFTHGLRSI